MKKTGEWGQFFPAGISPFPYNDSLAQDYFPLTKDEVITQGLKWYDRDVRDYKVTLPHEKLPAKTVEAIDGVDILVVPIGGSGVLSPAVAHKLAVQFETKLIIPSHYGDIGTTGALKTFLKEAGEEGAEQVDKLTIKKKDLEGKEGDVVVISSSV